MNVGFTGTREGMSDCQRTQFVHLIQSLPLVTFHHGAARGADDEARRLVERCLEVSPPLDRGVRIVAHPAGANPLQRNRELVAAVDVLIAAPRSDREELRSGTWATVRYARQAGKAVVMLSRGPRKATTRSRLQYVVISKREGCDPYRRKYWSRKAVERRLTLLGPEPWIAYTDKGPDELECCKGTAYDECACGGLTVREASDEKRSHLPAVEWVRVEQRRVTTTTGAWEPCEDVRPLTGALAEDE